MEEYSLYTDFKNYIKENEKLVTYLTRQNSLLNEYISPVIKSLNFLNELINKEEDEETVLDMKEVFEVGFHFLFENIEQIKLYLKQLNNDYNNLEKMELYIRIVFNLEELKVEIDKSEQIETEDKESDLKRIDEALEFFEERMIPHANINEFDSDKYLQMYYQILDKYPNIVLMSQAFEEYCATYGI